MNQYRGTHSCRHPLDRDRRVSRFSAETTPLPARFLTVVVILVMVTYGSFSDISDDEDVTQQVSGDDSSLPPDFLTVLEERILQR
ncbi:MAG: hypothetical protein F9B45_16640 [Phycisphaera sp. RhM]|nr:hypothetical protein [Phycisphaera sp. RhM]